MEVDSVVELKAWPYLIALFQECLVIFTQCDAENDRGDVFKAVNPFLSLAALAADVEHAT